MNRFLIIFIIATLYISCNKKTSSSAQSDAFYRGESVYKTVCISCHNRDPRKVGALAPDIAGSSNASTTQFSSDPSNADILPAVPPTPHPFREGSENLRDRASSEPIVKKILMIVLEKEYLYGENLFISDRKVKSETK